MASIIITEKQMEVIAKHAEFQNNLKLAEQNWKNFSEEEKEFVLEICKVLYPSKSKLIKEAKWYNLVGDILGIADPTGIVDIVNGISYFSQGDHLFGLLSLISAIPIAGKVVAKPVIGALKIGGAATKELKIAMDLAKIGKTAEASASLSKLAKEPGIVGKFLQSAKTWAPKVASKVEMLPGGILKGFKNTILDYLKLLENAGAKSAKFQKYAGNLSKYIGRAAKPVENIKALEGILKNEKVFTGLTKRGPLSNIFLGGAPRLFGNRRMRILMRQTKWWLGFLDYIGAGNFVGPEELASKMGEENLKKQMEEYNKTPEANQYAREDFGNQNASSETSSDNTTSSQQTSSDNKNPFQDWLSGIFSNNMGKAALTML
jgi:hypothetical protein